MPTYGQDTCTLFLRVQSAQNLSTHANAAFCTAFVWSNSSQSGPAQPASQPKYSSFSSVRADQSVEWNEEVQVDVTDAKDEVLTIRVKDSSDALVGNCNIYLAHLRPREALNQWFQLHPVGHIHLKLVLNPNQRFIPNPQSPYSTDYQALLELALQKKAAAVNQSPLPSNIATLLEIQNKANENVMLMMNQQLQQQQQATMNFMQTQSQSPYPVGYGYPAQSSGANIYGMLGAANDISTIATNLQQLNDNTGGDTSGLGTIASISLAALGLGPFGASFGS